MKLLDDKFFDGLSAKAAESARKRAHFNLHETLEEDIHRLCVAADPATYVRPHRHARKWELLIILKGSASVLMFDNNGVLFERVELSAGADGAKAVEIDADVLHCFVSNAKGTVVLEVKHGPYVPIAESDFAGWAPPEGSPAAVDTLNWMRSAQKGQSAGQ